MDGTKRVQLLQETYKAQPSRRMFSVLSFDRFEKGRDVKQMKWNVAVLSSTELPIRSILVYHKALTTRNVLSGVLHELKKLSQQD